MIKDCLDNAGVYYNISKNLKRGFAWLKSNDLAKLESGKYIIDGDRIYANVQEYNTKTEAKYEAHKKYIDIQYMIRGEELVGVCSKSNCTTYTEYEDSADIEFLDCKKEDIWQKLEEGEFLVLFPQDAHKPSMSVKTPQTVKKAVVKIAIE